MKVIEDLLNYRFKNTDLLNQALTHKSFAYETQGVKDNERLEFLGDAVLQLSITDILIETFPQDSEGVLSKKRAHLVGEGYLVPIAKRLKLQEFLKLGKGELLTGGKNKPRLLACTLEAIIGAIYLDSDFVRSKAFVADIFKKGWKSSPSQKDFKSLLQEKTQALYQNIPEYSLTRSQGPDHSKVFYMEVLVNGDRISQGHGRTKKEAQQMAAQKALEKLAH